MLLLHVTNPADILGIPSGLPWLSALMALSPFPDVPSQVEKQREHEMKARQQARRTSPPRMPSYNGEMITHLAPRSPESRSPHMVRSPQRIAYAPTPASPDSIWSHRSRPTPPAQSPSQSFDTPQNLTAILNGMDAARERESPQRLVSNLDGMDWAWGQDAGQPLPSVPRNELPLTSLLDEMDRARDREHKLKQQEDSAGYVT